MPRSHINSLFVWCEQIEEQRANAHLPNSSRHELIARTMAAAPRSVREQDDAGSAGWHAQLTFQRDSSRRNLRRFASCGSGFADVCQVSKRRRFLREESRWKV